MSHLITAGAVNIVPDAITEYRSSRDSQNIVHVIPGRPNPDVTLRPSLNRTGSFRMSFASADACIAAENAHAAGVVMTLTSTTLGVAMSYIVTGQTDRDIDSTTVAWWFAVQFQEVTL